MLPEAAVDGIRKGLKAVKGDSCDGGKDDAGEQTKTAVNG